MNAHNDMARLLVVDPRTRSISHASISALPALLQAGDVVVVNDAATLPASLFAEAPDGSRVELRLAEAPRAATCRVVLFGEGDYRLRTEERPAPPRLHVGDRLSVAGHALEVLEVSALSSRLVTLRFPARAEARYALLYAAGRPIQYSHVPEPYALWDVQTAFAARPWAVEMPSAARPLRWGTLLALLRKGVHIARVTHGAGLSATGDPVLDAALPLSESYDIPVETVRAIDTARARGKRVIAIGTSATRALEDCALRHGSLRAGEGRATLVLSATTRLRVVHGILSGIHVPGESHYALLSAFADADTLARAAQEAERAGYLRHEQGDACLVLPGALPDARAA
jgi:S-adenosylmethionine:tRNA ribosyltransferase-isomerase